MFVEGLTTNGNGLIPFKKGAFDIGASVKISHIKYEAKAHPNLNLMSVGDTMLLCLFQWRIKVTYTEIEGNFRPKNFTTWEEYAEETRKLMGKTFNVKLYKGHIKEKMQMEKEVSTIKYYY